MTWGEFQTYIGAAGRQQSRFWKKLLRVVFVGAQCSQEDVDDLNDAL